MENLMRVNVMIITIFVLCVSSPACSMALTTFGKSSPQNQNQNPTPSPTPAGKARECTTESNCAGIPNTSCMINPRDNNMRCLCGDYSAPINGFCANKVQAVRAPCKSNSDCGYGAQCIYGNNTSLPGKRCYCKEGYYEENLMCNGASSLLGLSTFTFLVIFLLLRSLNRM